MEKISEFFIEHWIIILCINILAIIAIVVYLIVQIKQKHASVKDDKKNIVNNQILANDIVDNNLFLSPNNTKNEEINIPRENVVIETKIANNNEINFDSQNRILTENKENLQEINTSSNTLQEKIEKITKESNKNLEELDILLPDKKIISDELKEKMETFEDIEPIKETEKSVIINTDIELPEITLSTEEKDIWN